MSPGHQQSWEPGEGSSTSTTILPATSQIQDSIWADFDADFTQPAFINDAPTAPNRGLIRRAAMGRLRASSLPSSVQDGPRMTESEWQQIDECLEGLYDFRRSVLYAPPSIPISEQQPSAGIVRTQTAPTASAPRPRMLLEDDSEAYLSQTRPRMVLEDDGEAYPSQTRARMVLEDDGEVYLPQVKTRLRKRDILKSFGANLATKFKKLSRAETYTPRPATSG